MSQPENPRFDTAKYPAGPYQQTEVRPAAPAYAMQAPQPCGASEPRIRCVPYDPAEVVRVPAAVGGSLAIGHPFGATGGRITVTLLNELRRRGEQFGMISVCAAGAMGFVMIVEAAPN